MLVNPQLLVYILFYTLKITRSTEEGGNTHLLLVGTLKLIMYAVEINGSPYILNSRSTNRTKILTTLPL